MRLSPDDMFLFLSRIETEDASLELDPVEDDDTGWRGWELKVDCLYPIEGDRVVILHGDSPAECFAKAVALLKQVDQGDIPEWMSDPGEDFEEDGGDDF